jgi:hypothetical protein
MRTIGQQNWYKPSEIANLGLIKGTLGERGTTRGHYEFVLGLIKSGKLKAKNYAHGEKAYFLVSQSEIDRYLSEWEK